MKATHCDVFTAGAGPEALSTSDRWSRPSVPIIDPQKEPLIFQQLDLDFYTGQWLRGHVVLDLRMSHYVRQNYQLKK